MAWKPLWGESWTSIVKQRVGKGRWRLVSGRAKRARMHKEQLIGIESNCVSEYNW